MRRSRRGRARWSGRAIRATGAVQSPRSQIGEYRSTLALHLRVLDDTYQIAVIDHVSRDDRRSFDLGILERDRCRRTLDW